MYKCTECGSEYQIKPDFCDCGNDCFTIVQQEKKEYKIEKQAEHPDLVQRTEPQSNFAVNSDNKRMVLKPSIDPVSLIIFIVCLILSVLVILFAWNPKEQGTSELKTEQQMLPQKIPNIDKLWNSTPPVSNVSTVNEDVKSKETIKAPENIIKVKVAPQQIQKKAAQQKKTTQTKVNQNITTNQIKKTNQVQPVKAPTVQQAQVQKTNMNETEPKQTTVVSQDQEKIRQEQARKSAEAKQELNNYKISLRNTIGRKIDFTKVIGDGSCTVSFKINESGRLVSRSFTKQSTNITLNDAVYSAVMSTPVYNPPPSGYNNETLNLNIKFYNGNFEITLN